MRRVQVDDADSTLRGCGSARSAVHHVNTHSNASEAARDAIAETRKLYRRGAPVALGLSVPRNARRRPR